MKLSRALVAAAMMVALAAAGAAALGKEPEVAANATATAEAAKAGDELAVGDEGKAAVDRLATVALEGLRAVVAREENKEAAQDLTAAEGPAPGQDGQEAISDAAAPAAEPKAAAAAPAPQLTQQKKKQQQQQEKAAEAEGKAKEAAVAAQAEGEGEASPVRAAAAFKTAAAQRLQKAGQKAADEASVDERRAHEALQQGMLEANRAHMKALAAAAAKYRASEQAAKGTVSKAHAGNAATLEKEVAALAKAKGKSQADKVERDLDVEELRRLLKSELAQGAQAKRHLESLHTQQLRLLQQYEAMVTTLASAWKETEKKVASGRPVARPEMAAEESKVRAAVAKAEAEVKDAGAAETALDERAKDAVKGAAEAKPNAMELRIKQRRARMQKEQLEEKEMNDALEKEIRGGAVYRGPDLLARLRKQEAAEKKADDEDKKEEREVDERVQERDTDKALDKARKDAAKDALPEQTEEEKEKENAAAGTLEGNVRIPYSYVMGQPKNTQLDNKEVDMIARMVLRQGRKHRCKQQDEWCQMTLANGQLGSEPVPDSEDRAPPSGLDITDSRLDGAVKAATRK